MYHSIWHASNGTGIDTRAGITSGQPTVCIAVNIWVVACNELYSWYVEECGGYDCNF